MTGRLYLYLVSGSSTEDEGTMPFRPSWPPPKDRPKWAEFSGEDAAKIIRWRLQHTDIHDPDSVELFHRSIACLSMRFRGSQKRQIFRYSARVILEELQADYLAGVSFGEVVS